MSTIKALEEPYDSAGFLSLGAGASQTRRSVLAACGNPNHPNQEHHTVDT